MIAMIQGWFHNLRCRMTGCPSSHEVVAAQETRVRDSVQRLDRVENKLDQMIIRKAGSDFLAEALANQEADRGR